MPAPRYMEESGSAAMLAGKRLIGVAPEVNLTECVTRMSRLHRAQIWWPNPTLKPKEDVTRSPK